MGAIAGGRVVKIAMNLAKGFQPVFKHQHRWTNSFIFAEGHHSAFNKCERVRELPGQIMEI